MAAATAPLNVPAISIRPGRDHADMELSQDLEQTYIEARGLRKASECFFKGCQAIEPDVEVMALRNSTKPQVLTPHIET